MIKLRRTNGPHILDGITELLIALLLLRVAIIPQFNVISSLSFSVIFFRFVVPIILMSALFLIGILTSWQYFRDQQKADSESTQIQFQTDENRTYGWWKQYRSIRSEGTTLYVPFKLFELMKRDEFYTVEYWPRSGIVVRIENAEGG